MEKVVDSHGNFKAQDSTSSAIVKHVVLIKLYLRSILDIIAAHVNIILHQSWTNIVSKGFANRVHTIINVCRKCSQ